MVMSVRVRSILLGILSFLLLGASAVRPDGAAYAIR